MVDLVQCLKRAPRLAAAALVFALAPGAPHAAEAGAPAATAAIGKEPRWPVAVQSGAATLTVHPPQLDTWDGHTLAARLAAAAGKDSPQTTYGVIEIAARTLTDKGTRVVTIDEARVTRADFPAASATEAKRWRRPGWRPPLKADATRSDVKIST